MDQVTIKDVAKEAEVSPSTVSRVISDSDQISFQTKEKVKNVMKRLGYQPNAIARSLVNQRCNSLGLVMARPTDRALANPFFTDIIQGIAAGTQRENYSLMLATAESYQRESEEVLNLVKTRQVDGLILMASRTNGELINNLTKENYPFVLIGRSQKYSEIPRVDNNNIKAVKDAVTTLLSLGYRDIVFLSGPKDFVVSQDRLQGYREALLEAEIPFRPELINYADFSYEAGFKKARQLFSNYQQNIDLVFGADDLLALGALRAAEERGWQVPEDIGIIGFNDTPAASLVHPGLTTIKIPIKKMGEKAAQMLVKIIEEESYQGEEIIIPTEIVWRESTAQKE